MPSRRALALFALAAMLGDPAGSAVIQVDTLEDAGAGNCTLREAILAANTDTPVDGCTAGAGPDEIDLTALAGTLQLGAGQIDIASEITVLGPGARTLRIRGTTNRMFAASAPANATFRDVTIGDASLAIGNGVCFALCGAALTLERVRVTNCDGAGFDPMSGVFGGAIGVTCQGDHDVRIRDSLLDESNVQLPISGGGAVALSGGSLTIENSTLSGNTTSGAGGALRLDGGAGAELRNVTLHGNQAALGASLFLHGGASASVANSAFAAGAGSAHCEVYEGDGALGSLDFNVADDASCAFAAANDQVLDAMLLPLADNGGPTDTHYPGDASPLAEGGDPAGCRDAADLLLDTDQRGAPRPAGDRCDVGAVEVGPCAPNPQLCTAAGRGSLALAAATPGKEKLDLALSAFAEATAQADFGDPVTGDSDYAVCVYAGDALAAGFAVDRAGDACGTKACWKSLGPPPPSPKGKGFAYKDALLDADGVLKLSMKGGPAGKGKVTLAVRGGTLAGTFDALTGATAVTAQLHSSAGLCLGATLDQIAKDDPAKAKFKALLK